jgi:acyl-CoA dehydrogenase
MTTTFTQFDPDVDSMLLITADELFARHGGPDALRQNAAAGWLPEAWHRASELDLHRVELDETGSGNFAYTVTVVRAAARHLAQIPLAETAIGLWLLAEVGAVAPDGPLAVSGAMTDVPYGRCASAILVIGEDELTIVPASSASVTQRENLAGEPRDDVQVVQANGVVRLPAPPSLARAVELRLALAGAAKIYGALEAVRALTLAHAKSRIQFGVPIAKFPLVRERLALLAEEVAAAGAAVDVARRAVAEVDDPTIAVAAAKVRTGMAAGAVARLAHQLHGAIGVTSEHVLQLYTRRLWAWRDEDGDEREWATRLGEELMAGDAWPRVVAEARA